MVNVQEVVVVTARRMADGAPVYLTKHGHWTRALQEAAILSPDEGTKEASERGQSDQAVVADPYTFKVEVRDGVIDPLTTRERIRSEGPSIRMRRPD